MKSPIEFLTLAQRADGAVPVISDVKFDPSKSKSVIFKVTGEIEEVRWSRQQLEAGESIVRVDGKLYRLNVYFGFIADTSLDLNASLEPLSTKP